MNAVGTENSPSKASSTSSSPRRTATNSTKSNSPSVNENTRVENSKEIIYKMDKNGIQSNGSPMTNKKLSRSSVYPSGTNLTARDAFGRIPINHFSSFFFVFFAIFSFHFLILRKKKGRNSRSNLNNRDIYVICI